MERKGMKTKIANLAEEMFSEKYCKPGAEEISRELRFYESSSSKLELLEENVYEYRTKYSFQLDIYLKNKNSGECGSGVVASNNQGSLVMKIKFGAGEDYTILEFKDSPSVN